MKIRIVFKALILLCFSSLLPSTLPAAQDTSKWHLPEGAIARFGKGPVNEVAFSPDGKHLAVVSDIGVWIYNALNGTEEALLAGHTDSQVMNAVFSPDGHMIAVIVYDYAQDVQMWDTKTWTLKDKLRGYEQRASDVAFSPDGKTIAIADIDQTTQLWDLATMTPKSLLEGSTDNPANEASEFFSIAYSPKGDTFAIGAGDGTIRLWDTTTGILKHTFIGNITTVGSFSFSPDGNTIATRSFSNSVWQWDTATGRHKSTLEEGIGMMGGENISYSPNGNMLAIPAWDGLQLRDTTTGEHKNTLEYTVQNEIFAYSPDGNTIAVVGLSKNEIWTVWLWDTTIGKNKHTLEHTEEVESIAFSPDGRTIAAASVDNTVHVWDIETGKHKYTLGHTGPVLGVSYNPDRHNILTTVHRDKSVRVWDTQTRTPEHSFRLNEQTEDVSSVAFSPNGKTIATTSRGDMSVRLWDISAGIFKKMLTDNSIYSIGAFSPDGQILVSLGESRLYLFGIFIERENKILNIHKLLTKPSTHVFLRNIAFCPDGNTIAIQIDDRIMLWDMTTEKVTFTLNQIDRNTRIKGVVFSPDGYTIATRRGGEVQLWDIQRQEHKITLSKDRGVPLAFSPEGKTIATCDYNRVRLWNAVSGILLNTLAGHAGTVNGVAFSSDGKTIVTIGEDGTVLLWDLTSQHLNSNKED